MAEIDIDSEYENVDKYSDLRMETHKSHAYSKYKGVQQLVEQPPNPVTDGPDVPDGPDGPETKKEIICIRKLLVLLSIFILLLVIVVIVCVVVMLSWRYEMDIANGQRKLGSSAFNITFTTGGRISGPTEPTLSGSLTFNITFTTCGRISGPTGPTLSGCRTWYGDVWPRNGSLFNVLGGVQIWEVPETGYYTFDAYGAAGGYGNNNMTYNLTGGLGARIKGTFYLNAHFVLYIVVGQKGQNGGNSESGGGGGGTFVYTWNVGGSGLLIAAGGGGGSGEEVTHRGYDGYSGHLSLSSIGVVGISGRGGRGGNVTTAGAGWLESDGSNFGSDKGNPGSRWNGGISPGTPTGAGGFGGGGSGVASNGGGGGGGYTGGEGMSVSNRTLWGGSGGGSYNDGSNQINTSGYNDGPGYIIVTKN